MCGFTGYLNKNSIESSSSLILEMLKLQRHRGPDDSGVVGITMESASMEELEVDAPRAFTSSPNLIFGFNRLSILDLSPAGHQPMLHRKSEVALMMNGEIYNAFDFKAELEAKGVRLKGQSDTEIVLHLYLIFGLEGLLQRLNGMFALAIYDGRVQELYLVRDRMGIKPLYVLKDEKHLAFSSEMKSFKALPDYHFQLDETRLSEFLLFRNAINQTLFKDIVNITPGTYWKITANGRIAVHTYYDVRDEAYSGKEIGKEQLESALRKSVKQQMISDVKLGCQLSGGVDSSLVTAYAAETLEKGALETVSIVFDEASFSEKKYIDQVAARYSLKSHQFTLNGQAYLDLLDEASWHFEQPINHPNTIGIKLLSKEAKKHVTVLLSGEGADECLAGYDRFLPPSNRFFHLNTLKKAIKNRNNLGTFLSLSSNSGSRYVLQTAYGGIGTAASLYSAFSAKQAIVSRMNIWNSINDNVGLKKRKYELLSYLPDLLMRQDKMSMAHSIENRVPFLDNEMVKTSLQISEDLLVKKENGRWDGKWLLKELCSDAFDHHFAYRDKMGFGIPLRSFMGSSSFKNRWESVLLPGISKRGLFNANYVDKLYKNLSLANPEELDAIWLMSSFEIWAEKYLD